MAANMRVVSSPDEAPDRATLQAALHTQDTVLAEAQGLFFRVLHQLDRQRRLGGFAWEQHVLRSDIERVAGAIALVRDRLAPLVSQNRVTV